MKKSLIVSCVLIFSALTTFSATYYVSPAGQNGATGTYSEPFFMIQEAIDNCGSENDTILLLEGTYWQRISFSGKSNILLNSYNPFDKSTISGSGVDGTVQVYIENCDSIFLSNLIFRENYAQEARCIYAVGSGNGLFISDCEFFNCGWGSDAGADPESFNPVRQSNAILVNGRESEPWNNVYIGRNFLNDLVLGNSEAITLTGNVTNFLIEENRIHDITNIGIDVAGHYSWAFPAEGDPALNQARNGRIRRNTVFNCERPTDGNEPAGIYADGAANVYIDNNEVFASGSGISVCCEVAGFNASNIQVVENIMYSNTRFGAVFGANAGGIDNCVFRNNTLFNNGEFFDNSGAVSLQKSSDSKIQNNIIYVLNSDYYGLSLFGWQVDNLTLEKNLFYCPTGENERLYAFNPAEGSSYNEETLWFGDPGFVSDSPLSPHFQLILSSPAVNSGSQNLVLIPDETDMNGLPVVLDGIDVGAYMSDLSTSLHAQAQKPLLFPLPAFTFIYFRLPAEDISIYSMDGRLVDAGKGVFLSYDVSNLPSGIYLLRFKCSDKEQSSRIVVSRD